MTDCHMHPGRGILQRNRQFLPLTQLHESLHTDGNLKIVTYLLTIIEGFMVIRTIYKEGVVIRKSLMRVPVNLTKGNHI